MTPQELTFIDKRKDQPPRKIPHLAGVVIDLTRDPRSVEGLDYGDAVTTGAGTPTHIVIEKVDPATGHRTGEVALAPIPRITDEEVE